MLKMEEIKLKKLAATVQVLNDSGLIKEKIKVIGQPKEKLVTAFIEAVKAIPGGAGGKHCPEAVAEFYNLINPPEEKPVKVEKVKQEAKVKTEKTEKQEPEEKRKQGGIGIIKTIVSSIQKKSLTKAEILEILVAKFPDRPEKGMKATVGIQLSPARLGQKYKLVKNDDRYRIEG